MSNKQKDVVCRVPTILYDAIGDLEKEFKRNGLYISRPQISIKLGHDLKKALRDSNKTKSKFVLDVPYFNFRKQKRVDLGGGISVKIKKG